MKKPAIYSAHTILSHFSIVPNNAASAVSVEYIGIEEGLNYSIGFASCVVIASHKVAKHIVIRTQSHITAAAFVIAGSKRSYHKIIFTWLPDSSVIHQSGFHFLYEQENFRLQAECTDLGQSEERCLETGKAILERYLEAEADEGQWVWAQMGCCLVMTFKV